MSDMSYSHPVLYDQMENKIAVLDNAYNVKVTQRFKQEWTVEFNHPLDDANKWTLIHTECIVQVEGQQYVIKVIDTDDSSGAPVLQIQGEHVSIQTNEEYIDPADDTSLGRTSLLYGVSAQTALQNALLGSRFTVGTVNITSLSTTLSSDAQQNATTITVANASGFTKNTLIQIGSTQATITNISGNTFTISPALYSKQTSGTPVGVNLFDINMQERNLMDVLREIETTWNGDLSFDNRTVSLLTQMGQSNGVSFRYKKNNKEIKRTEDTRNLVTRLYGYGAGGLTIESINPKKYLDASTINSYPYPRKLKKDYSNIADPESLLIAMQADLNTLSAPKVTYQLTIVELSKVLNYPYPTLETFGLGDYVTVIDERLNDLSIVSRITQIERYPYDPLLSTLQIDSLIDTQYDQLKNIHSNVTGLLQTVNISPRRNGRPIGTVSNPSGSTPSITYTQNTDGSINLIIGWSFTEDSTSPIDGFGVVVHADTNSTVYTFPSTISADSKGLVDKFTNGIELNGVPANKYYTVAVYPYRNVDNDIDSSTQIKGGLWYANGGNPYQPMSMPIFTGNVQDKFGNVVVDQNGLNLLNTNGWGVQSGLLLSYSNFNPPTSANNYTGLTITSLSQDYTLQPFMSSPPSTINVASTSGFPSSGWAWIAHPGYWMIRFQYTGITPTSFTGVSNIQDSYGSSGYSGTYASGSKVFIYSYPTATINVSSGIAVNQQNVQYQENSFTFNTSLNVAWDDYDGWIFKYVYIDPSGNIQVVDAGTSGGQNSYPPNPPTGSTRLGWFIMGNGAMLPSGQIGSGGKEIDENGVPYWSIITRMDINYRDVRPSVTNTTSNTSQNNLLSTGAQQNSITVNAGQTYVMYIPIGAGVKKQCNVNISPNTTVSGVDASRTGAAMVVAPQPNGSNAGTRYIWGTYVDTSGYATNVDQQQNNANYGNYMIPPSVLGCTYTVIQDLDVVPDPSTPSQTDLKVVFYNYSATNETLNLRFNWHSF